MDDDAYLLGYMKAMIDILAHIVVDEDPKDLAATSKVKLMQRILQMPVAGPPIKIDKVVVPLQKGDLVETVEFVDEPIMPSLRPEYMPDEPSLL